jgi:molybdenum cofactor biosynthesis enzyme MoaA
MNLSIHTLNEQSYEALVGVKNSYQKMLCCARNFKEKYPDVEIRLNTTVLNRVNSSAEDIMSLVRFAEKIGASIKVVELFPSTAEEYIPLSKIEKILVENGFMKIPSKTRKIEYTNNLIKVSATKIFCAIADEKNDPGHFCKKNNDLFVSPDGKIKPCRYDKNEIDIFSEIKERNIENVADKIKFSMDISNNKCKEYLKNIHVHNNGRV